jgi:hypothetical protein
MYISVYRKWKGHSSMARGRKPKPEETRKSASISARISVGTRLALDKAATAGKRSISEEIDARLTASFEVESEGVSRWGSTPQARALAALLCRVIDAVEEDTGARFHKDRFTYDHVCKASGRILDAFRPEGSDGPPSTFPKALADLDEINPGVFTFTDEQRAAWAAAAPPPGERAAYTVLTRMLNEPGTKFLNDEQRAIYREIRSRIGNCIQPRVILEISKALGQGAGQMTGGPSDA